MATRLAIMVSTFSLVEDSIEVLIVGIGLAQLCFFGDQPFEMFWALSV